MAQVYCLADGKELRIVQDDCVESPREWDSMSTMVCFHKRYNLGDEHSYNSSDFSGWGELKEQLEKDNDIAIILPLYMYDHSGITISTQPFSCRWDSGQIGWVFITKDTIRKEYNLKKVSKKALQRALTVLLGEVRVYDQYLRGEVYGFELIERVTCDSCGHTHENQIDSCYGFFGDDIKTNGILDNLSKEIREELEPQL